MAIEMNRVGSLRGSHLGTPIDDLPAGVYDRLPTVRENDFSYAETDEMWISLTTARTIALALHARQVDKAGRDYGEHILAVAAGVRVLGGDTHDEIAALFHDAVEDGHITFEMLAKLGVSEISLASLDAVTKRKGESSDASLRRVLLAGPRAQRLKLADLLSNTRHDRVALLRAMAGDDKAALDTIDLRLGVYQHWIRSIMVMLDLLPAEVGL